MKLHTLSMTMSLVALSIAGCAAGDQDGVQTQPAAEIKVCEGIGVPCLGDTICGQDHCEPAFDRVYQVGVRSMWIASTRLLDVCDRDPDCAMPPRLEVFFSNLADPILVAQSSYASPAQIMVTGDSYLVVALGETSCVIDLSAEVLDRGEVTCDGPNASVSLAIDAL
jgi:hypothetical protein